MLKGYHEKSVRNRTASLSRSEWGGSTGSNPDTGDDDMEWFYHPEGDPYTGMFDDGKTFTYWYTSDGKGNYYIVADMDGDGRRFIKECAADGNIIFTPHVNYSKTDFSLRKIEGEPVIQHGLVSVKGCGMKAAIEIYNERKKNGLFRSYDDFYDRCRSRVVNARVLRVLEEAGALEFNKKRYIEQVTKYNTNLLLSSEG